MADDIEREEEIKKSINKLEKNNNNNDHVLFTFCCFNMKCNDMVF